MNRRPRAPRIACITFVLALAAGAAACTGEDAGGAVRASGAGGIAATLGATAAALGADTAAPPARPDEIYYDLTVYEWYRHGEPLVAEGFAFQPDGVPRPIPLDSLHRAGNYQGVDYYVRNGAAQPHDTLFVPVFDDFWQPFLPVGPAPAVEPAPPPAQPAPGTP